MRLLIALVLATVTVAHADSTTEPPAPEVGVVAAPAAAVDEPLPVVGFVVRGDSKVRPRTLGQLARVALGERIGPADLARIEQALVSSELFREIKVALEPGVTADGARGVVLVATANDKHSWIVAPTVFALPGNKAFGVGYVENNFRGLNQKYLLYGQIGTRTSLLFATFLDPAFRGGPVTWRADLYTFRRNLEEYANPHDDPSSFDIERRTRVTYLGAAGLVGWRFRWWLTGDLRLRGAYVYFRDAETGDGAKVALPERDGWDVTLQSHLTIDHRHHRRGVTWGPYAQLTLESSVPGIDSYHYQLAMLRAYHSWRLFGEHQLELRGHLNVGRHLPLHEDVTLGGVPDLRGYDVDQFRGDVRAVARAEYSVPLGQWKFLSFRAIGFYDAGYLGVHFPRADRDYLANQRSDGYTRSNVGGGLRVYLDNIVLPLLGLDLGYGLESRSPEIYFEVGLTDF